MSHQTILKQRQKLHRAIREFFWERDFVEVETPVLIFSNAPELHIDALRVEVQTDRGRQRRYLRTSPELALKRWLAAGASRIFELARVMRDGEHDSQHRVEFTLLEWYRANSDYQAIMDDCDALLHHCCCRFAIKDPVVGPHGRCDLAAAAERLTVAEAFEKYVGLDIRPYMAGDSAKLAAALKQTGCYVPSDKTATFEDLFYSAFLSKIEPNLGVGRPTILYEWPAPMAALARPHPANPTVALRFELYAGGAELANAFDELTDAVVQQRRFEETAAARLLQNRDPYPLDHAFLQALPKMPASGGIALGFERLLMLLTGSTDISQVAISAGPKQN